MNGCVMSEDFCCDVWVAGMKGDGREAIFVYITADK